MASGLIIGHGEPLLYCKPTSSKAGLASPSRLTSDLNAMFRSGHTEQVDRPEPEPIESPFLQRNLDLLSAVEPCSVFIHLLETPEVGRTRAKEHAGLVTLDGHFRRDDIGRPLDPVPPGRRNKIRRVVGPVGLAIAIPRIIKEYLVGEHDERGAASGRKCGETVSIHSPATPAIGFRPCLQLAGFGIGLHGLSVGTDNGDDQ